MRTSPPLFARERRGGLVRLVLSSLGQTGAAAAAGLLLARLIDQAMAGAEVAAWAATAAFLAAAALTAALLRLLERRLAEDLAQRTAAEARESILRQAFSLELPALRRRRRGALMLRFVGDLQALGQFAGHGVAKAIGAAFCVPMLLGALAWLHPAFAAAAGATVAVSALILWPLSRWLGTRHQIVRQRRAVLSAAMGETVTEAPTIRALQSPRAAIQALLRQSEGVRQAALKRETAATLTRLTPETLALLALAAAVALSGATASAGAIAGALIVFGLLTTTLSDAATALDQFREYRVAREALDRFLSDRQRLRAPTNPKPLPAGDGRLCLTGWCADAANPDAEIAVEAGRSVGLHGESGAGKTRLLRIIAQLEDGGRGRITLDGVDLARLSGKDRRRAVRLASPDLPLMQGTVREQFPPWASAAEIEAAGRAAGLGESFARLPHGLKTRLFEGGANLPSGLRAQLMLARALVGRPRLILIDGLDSWLDGSGFEALQALTKAPPATLILATHNPVLLRLCARHWRMDGGKICSEASAPTAEDRAAPQAVIHRLGDRLG
jgi:ABC-type bacteriocin/lantibiotic exporter with double-glycine peptidase domain